jgi:hypothetical protein
MNDLVTDVIPLDYGLDLVEPKPVARSGSLSTCLNYEITDRSGLRRIDGYERFDGRLGGEANTFWRVGHSAGSVVVGDIIFVDTLGTLAGGDLTTEEGCEVFGVVVAVSTANLMVVAVINDGLFPVVRDADGYVTSIAPEVTRQLYKADKTTKVLTSLGSAASALDIRFFASSEQNHYNTILEYKDLLRSFVGVLSGTVLATYTYKGVHYAIVNETGGETAKIFYCASEKVEAGSTSIAGLHGGWRALDMGHTAAITAGKGVGGNNVWNRVEQGLENAVFAGADPLYYMTDGSSVFTCRLVSYYITSGTIVAGNAAGQIQLADITKISGPASFPASGYSVYTTTSYIEANRVFTVSGSITAQTLPGLNRLQVQRSRYQLMDTNYYATEGLGSVYGVSGASRPFYFNQDYFAYVYTQATESVSARHIERTADSLALGYPDGQVVLSVSGEPWNYSGVDGAYVAGFGHPIRGLLQLQGDTLAIFTSKSVNAIQGTTVDNYVPRVLAPKTGVVEYTVAQLTDAIFCSPSGVMTLSQSDKYGDFAGEPISYKVNPLLRPKTSKEASIVAATVVRNKNQYRVFSADGTVFTFTFREGKGFESTTQKYYVGRNSIADAEGREFIPVGLSSVLDENGEEYILGSHYAPYSRSTSNYVYRLEQGWGFDGQSIPSSFDVNWYFAGNPFMNKVLRKVRVDGISLGRATVAVRTAKDYDNNNVSSAVRASLPRRVEFIQINETPYTSMANVEERGLNIAVKVEHLPELSASEPTHTIQTLFIQFTGAKSDA